MAEFFEHGNEHSVTVKRGEFLKSLSDYQLIKNESMSWSWLVGYKLNNFGYETCGQADGHYLPIMLSFYATCASRQRWWVCFNDFFFVRNA